MSVFDDPKFATVTLLKVKGFTWYFIRQASTGDCRWIERSEWHSKGLPNAYYDADPAFKPSLDMEDRHFQCKECGNKGLATGQWADPSCCGQLMRRLAR